MTRAMTELAAASSALARVRTAHLFRATFTNSSTGIDETYHLTDNFRSVRWNGDEYVALGHLLAFEGIEESSDLQISSARVTLSGVDSSLIAAVLQYQYMDRSLEIWRVFFAADPVLGGNANVVDDAAVWDDDAVFSDTVIYDTPDDFRDYSENLVSDPIKIFDGTMDAPSIADDPASGTMAVQLAASSHFADFDRRPGRHTNHQEQQAHFPGDRFFEWVGRLDRDIVWGRAG